jgi:hypothetical protein
MYKHIIRDGEVLKTIEKYIYINITTFILIVIFKFKVVNTSAYRRLDEYIINNILSSYKISISKQ